MPAVEWTKADMKRQGLEEYFVNRYDWRIKASVPVSVSGARRKTLIRREKGEDEEKITLVSYHTEIYTITDKWHLTFKDVGPWADENLDLAPEFISAMTSQHIGKFRSAFPQVVGRAWTRKRYWW